MHACLSLRPPGWSLRVILAWAMLLSPLAAVQAQKPSQPRAKSNTLDTTWLTPDTVAVGYLRPRQILAAEGAELLPREIFDAVVMKEFGVEAADIDSITWIVELSEDQQPLFAVVVKSTKPLNLMRLSPEMKSRTQAAESNGKTYLKGRDINSPSFYLRDDLTLIAASDPIMQKLLERSKKSVTSPLIAEIKNRPATDDLYVAVDIKSLRPLITQVLDAHAAQVPPQFQKYLREAPELVRSVEFAFNLSKPTPPLLNLYGNDEQAAEALAALIDEGMAEVRQQMAMGMAQQMSDDPVEQALMAYSARRSEAMLEALKPVIDGDKLTFFPADPDNPNPSVAQLQKIAVIGFLVALLLPAVQAAREAARRNDTLANLRDFSVAMQNYHDTKGKFPAHANYSEDGKPLLSWRVHLLPYMEEQPLHREFRLDEPWDSEHNKQLIAKMPDILQSSGSPLNQADGKTLFVAPIGEGFVMDGTKDGVGIRQLTDGTSRTIYIVEADPDKAVIWTKPDDLQVDLENPTAGLGKLRAGIFIAAFADGHAAQVSTALDPATIKALFTRNGREVIQIEDLNP